MNLLFTEAAPEIEMAGVSRISPSDRPLRSPSVALAPSCDGYLAYELHSDRIHHLNPTAALILELSDGSRSTEALVAELDVLFGSEGQAACTGWIEHAHEQGLLIALSEAVHAPCTLPAEEFGARASALTNAGLLLPAFICQHYTAHLLPDDAEKWGSLGFLARALGRREDARYAYEQYSRLKPEDAEVAQILSGLRDVEPPPRAPDACIEQLFARFASSYDDVMVRRLGYMAPAHLTAALVADRPAAAEFDVLELGCGTGLTGQKLRPLARHLVGIDLSKEMLERAASTGVYDQLEVAEITEWLSRTDAADFDLIASCDTLNYFGDLGPVLIQAAKRLRPGGRLAFTLERAESHPFKLTDSGRYAHSELYLREIAQSAGLAVSHRSVAILRHEFGEGVAGLVAVLQRSPQRPTCIGVSNARRKGRGRALGQPEVHEGEPRAGG